MSAIKAYIKNHKNRFINELIEILKIPFISTDSTHKKDILNTANFVLESLKKAGCNTVEICET